MNIYFRHNQYPVNNPLANLGRTNLNLQQGDIIIEREGFAALPLEQMNFRIDQDSTLIVHAHGGITNDNHLGCLMTSATSYIRADKYISNLISKFAYGHNISKVVLLICHAKHHNWQQRINADNDPNPFWLQKQDNTFRGRREITVYASPHNVHFGSQGVRTAVGNTWKKVNQILELPVNILDENFENEGWIVFSINI